MSEFKILPGTRREIGWSNPRISVFDCFLSLYFNRGFLIAIARRDLHARYRGAVLGLLWLVGTPAALALAYGFMTIGVFKVRALGTESAVEAFVALWFLINLWQMMAETLMRSSAILSDNAMLVKRTAFPLGVLPPATFLVAIAGFSVSFLMLVIGHLIVVGLPPLSWVLLPLPLIPFVLITLGLSYIIATAGAYLRDLRYVLPLTLTVGMLTSPVLYPSQNIPAAIKFISQANPFMWICDAVRTLLSGSFDVKWESLFMLSLIGFGMTVAGYRWFKKNSSEFSDVL